MSLAEQVRKQDYSTLQTLLADIVEDVEKCIGPGEESAHVNREPIPVPEAARMAAILYDVREELERAIQIVQRLEKP